MQFVPLALILLFFIAACDSPSLSMRDVPAQRVEVGKMAFQVRIKEDRAEVIRVSLNRLPKKAIVLDAAAMAIELVAGCPVRTVEGDQSIVKAHLRCKDAPPPDTKVVILLDPY